MMIRLPEQLDSVLTRDTLERMSDNRGVVLDNIGVYPSPVTKSVTSSASVLMATGAENASGRTGVYIRNDGNGVALLDSSSQGGGRRLLPGEYILFRFKEDLTTGISIYARAETIATKLYIEEI